MTCLDVGFPEPENDLKIKINWENKNKNNKLRFMKIYKKKIITEFNVDEKMI